MSEAAANSTEQEQLGIKSCLLKKYCKSHGKDNDRIRLYTILKRGLNIVCYAMVAKFLMECMKKKLNILKIFKNSANIVKFAMAIAAVSMNFLLCRWTAGKIRRISIVKNFLTRNV